MMVTGNVSMLTESWTTGPFPDPVRGRTWGDVGASSAKFNEPLNMPLCVGVKVTVVVQFAPTSKLEPQVVVSENGALVLTTRSFRGALPLLVRSSVTGLLCMLTLTPPKLSVPPG